jgi:DNA polymerase-3 subunit delta'
MNIAVKDRTVPPWIESQLMQLLSQKGHAWLLQGSSGLGQFPLAFALARAWLCEVCDEGQPACGQCASCHAIDVAAHADLCLLMPETRMIEMGWPLSEKAQMEIDEKKRKASKEIRVDAMREAVEFSQRTSARGKGKVVLVYPAETMNAIAANTLLKTLEEPVGNIKFVLSTEAGHHILPTIRSRCMSHTMVWPQTVESLTWLQQNGVDAGIAESILRATGGKPAASLELALLGWDQSKWSEFVRAMTNGEVGAVQNMTGAQLIYMLQKLCHDMMCHAIGSSTRFFDVSTFPNELPSMQRLSDWAKALSMTQKNVEHPLNAGLLQEMLVTKAKSALNSQTC